MRVVMIVHGLPPGLGSHVQWDRKLDGRLAQAVMSIPAIKAVGIGRGTQASMLPGSRLHDEILPSRTRPASPLGVVRPTNNAGGLEGGITNGEDLRVTGYMKPIATLMKPLRSVDVTTMDDNPDTDFDEGGLYGFRGVKPGKYRLTEKQQDGWHQSDPRSGSYDIRIGSGDHLDDLNFGNFQPNQFKKQIQNFERAGRHAEIGAVQRDRSALDQLAQPRERHQVVERVDDRSLFHSLQILHARQAAARANLVGGRRHQ